MSDVNFSQFGKQFQEKLIQALLTDHIWSEQMLEVIDVNYFDLRYLQFLADKYYKYAKKYKVYPSFNLLIQIVKDDLKVGTDVVIRDQILEFLLRIKNNPDMGDLHYIKEKALDFCRKQALKQAFEVAIDQMQNEKYESIVETIKAAVMVGTAPTIGHDFFEDFEARFTKLHRRCIPTGIEELDQKEILNGGLGRGELGIVIGNAGSGKSHWLTQCGANAMKRKFNVVHYTLELSESQVGIRYDSNLCDIESTYIIDNKDKIIQKYKDTQGELGKLYIKEYPTSSATVYTLRSHLERLDIKGFKADLIIIDYADIMRSTRQYDALRHELKLIYEELRGLAKEKDCAIWSASQGNKESINSDIMDMGNMSESYGKAAVADFIIGLSRKPQEKASGIVRLYISKNRSGKDGLLYTAKIDTAKSTFQILGQSYTPAEYSKEEEKDLKKALKAKWNELKKDNIIKYDNDKGTSNDDSKKDSEVTS